MVPMWMFANAIACGNTFVLEAFGERSVGQSAPRGVDAESGRAGWSFQRASRRCRRRVAFTGASRCSGDQLRRFHSGGEIRIRDGHAERQASAGAWRREKSHGGPARRRYRNGGLDAAVSAAFGSAGERCMAISVVVAVDSAAGICSSPRSRSGWSESKLAPGWKSGDEMGPLITREHQRSRRRLHRNGDRRGRHGTVEMDGREAPRVVESRLLSRSLPARSRADRHAMLSR